MSYPSTRLCPIELRPTRKGIASAAPKRLPVELKLAGGPLSVAEAVGGQPMRTISISLSLTIARLINVFDGA
jgi:hypothetical protein